MATRPVATRHRQIEAEEVVSSSQPGGEIVLNAIKYLNTSKAGLRSTPEDDLDDAVHEPDTCSLVDEIFMAEVVTVDEGGQRRPA